MTRRTPLPLALALAACASSPPTGGDSARSLGGPLLDGPKGACDHAIEVAVSTTAELTAGGAARVSWGDPGAASHLRYTDALGQVRDLPRDADGGATLRGALPGAPVPWRVVVATDGLGCSDLAETELSPLPATLPELRRTLGEADAITPTFFATSVLTAERRFAVVLAPTGEVVWAVEAPDTVSPDSPLYRVTVRQDGEGVLANVHSSKDGPGALWSLSWTGQVQRTVQVDQMHRDFTELPDGTLAVLAYDSRTVADGAALRGDQVVTVAPDDTQAVAWNLFDDYDHGRGASTALEDPDDPDLQEYSHANGLHWDAQTDAWLITLPQLGRPDGPRPQGSLLSVDRETATTNWELSHTRGDFAVDDADTLYQAPHSMQRTDAGVLVYSRGAPEACSEAVEITLEDGTATPAWRSVSDDCVHTVFLGEAIRRSDGTTAIQHSSAGRLEVVDADGQPVWRVETDLGAAFGFLGLRDALDGPP